MTNRTDNPWMLVASKPRSGKSQVGALLERMRATQ